MFHRSKTLWMLAACAAVVAAVPAQAQTRGASASVTVSVVDGAVRVSSSPVAVPAGVSTITWQMAAGSSMRFAAGSIDFGDAAGGFSCRVFNDGAAISCNRSSSAPKGQLPYVIRLTNGGPLVQPPQPTVYISLE